MIFAHYNDIPLTAWPFKYFKPYEVACKGTGEILVNSQALTALDLLRSRLGNPISLSSAYRSKYHNAKIGGAPKSSHLLSIAYDIQLKGQDKETIRRVAEECGFRGFGMRYKTFIHCDMGRRRSW